MSLFTRILDRVFHAQADGLAARSWAPPADTHAHQAPPVERTAMALPSNVAAVLTARAERQGLGEAWRGSLDGLLAVLGLDASTQEREALAAELNLDLGGIATDRRDAALYEALIQRLAENGALAPDDFYK